MPRWVQYIQAWVSTNGKISCICGSSQIVFCNQYCCSSIADIYSKCTWLIPSSFVDHIRNKRILLGALFVVKVLWAWMDAFLNGCKYAIGKFEIVEWNDFSIYFGRLDTERSENLKLAHGQNGYKLEYFPESVNFFLFWSEIIGLPLIADTKSIALF